MTIIEIRAGEGGADALAFAHELQASITAYLHRAGHDSVSVDNQSERTVVIESPCPIRSVDWLSGTHRVQRIPSGAAARHTSTATVAVLPDREGAEGWVDPKDVRIDRYRGHGPGGQRRNKVATAIRLVHVPTGVTVTRETGRSQKENLRDAFGDLEDRLRSMREDVIEHERASSRRRQVRPGREAKTFTHNEQRSEVIDHANGRRWTSRDWARGRM